MTLKDLIAQKSEIAESAIEGIVAKYVRYYTDTLEVGFTPDGAALSGESRVLVYLVALVGWQYVTDSVPEISTKPADLEEVLGIPGGTLRPILKNLKDAHLIASSAKGYSAREGNLEAIAATISGEKKAVKRKATPPPKAGKTGADGSRSKRGSSSPVSLKLDAWINSDFFKVPRTLNAVHERLHEHGVIAPQTSISGPLLRAVQQGRLERQKVSEDGKKVWAYRLPEK